MKWAAVTDADLMGALNAVMYSYDPVAAENLIEYFHERFSNEMPYNQDVLLAFVKMAFRRIVDDELRIDIAFGLAQQKGKHRRDDTTERDVMAAAFVILGMRRGAKWSDAVGEAANLLMPDGTGDRALQMAYARYKECFSSLPDEVLVGLLPEELRSYRPI
ncbi:MAG TPA: hypothetical protein PK361_07700 [Chiayiivirga sp.]|nr:hypothetical protein [Chiayiivirga sp.]